MMAFWSVGTNLGICLPATKSFCRREGGGGTRLFCRSEDAWFLLAKDVNDNACFLNKRGVCEFFASKLAPTGGVCSA
ncbi:hypothetical protein PflCFBP13510_26075 [Pseudomonas fluorescens]|nr:hypothetical protein CDH05_18395 [Pseudomonas lactis]TKJ97666.1 hypothetical protein PflCFBP13510_26075 [Pseudomonas fluorescens]